MIYIYQGNTLDKMKHFSNLGSAMQWCESEFENLETKDWDHLKPDIWSLYDTRKNEGEIAEVYRIEVDTSDEADVLRDFAFKVLEEDPEACDAVRDILCT